MAAQESAQEPAHEPARGAGGEPLRVLVVDNDPSVSELMQAILTDEGYEVATLADPDHAAIAAAVGQTEPDCILLDGAHGTAFGDSWTEAAYLSGRARTVPTIMFTAHADAVLEASTKSSERASAAGFAAVIGKPFDLDELLQAVAAASGHSDRFERSEAADQDRTAALVDQLRAAGATDIRTSNRREWATFVSSADGRIYQLYWWQRLGRYVVGRYDDAARLEIIGQFFERSAAITAALGPTGTQD